MTANPHPAPGVAVPRGPSHAHGPEIPPMSERPMVALVSLLVAFHAAYQAYAWLVGTLLRVARSIP